LGFVEEGRQRDHAYIDGSYHDLLMGVLRPEYDQLRGRQPARQG